MRLLPETLPILKLLLAASAAIEARKSAGETSKQENVCIFATSGFNL
jgi:predicted outer membrane protein